MKITIKKYQSLEEFDKAVDNLRKGYGRRLSGGAFANVFKVKNSENRVVRIASCSDSGYLRWLKLVVQHQKNLHVPRVYKAIKHCGPDRFALETVMERLVPWKRVSYREKTKVFDRMMECAVWGGYDGDGYLADQWRPKTKAAKELKTLLEQVQANDTHDGNILFRKTAKGYQLVVTDPRVGCFY